MGRRPMFASWPVLAPSRVAAAVLAVCAGQAAAAGWGAAPMDPHAPQPVALQMATALGAAAPSRTAMPVTPAAAEEGGLVLMREFFLTGSSRGAASASGAASSAGPRLTLLDAFELALQNDATLQSARSTAVSRAERVPQARSQLLPQVSANANRFRNHLESTGPGATGEAVSSTQNYYSSARSLVVRQALFRPAQRADLRQAYAQVEEAEATLAREQQNLSVRLATAYLQVLSARQQLVLVQSQAQSYTGQLVAARRRFEGGSGTRTDVDEAQARLDLAVARELDARQAVEEGRRQLEAIVNVKVAELADIDPARLPLQPPDPPDIDAWTQLAEGRSPELRAARAQVDAAREEVEKARAAHLPTIDAVAQWSVSDSDNVTKINSRYDQKALGVQASVPIYTGGLLTSQQRQAAAELERLQGVYEATRRDLAVRVQKEFRGISESAARAKAMQQAVRSAEAVLESNRRSFQAGARTIVDVLNAEEQLSTARKDLAEARYTYVLATVRLKALTAAADEPLIRQASGWLAP